MVATPSATPRPRKSLGLTYHFGLTHHRVNQFPYHYINDLFGLQHVLKNCYCYMNYYIIVNILLNDFERLTNYFDIDDDDDVPDDTVIKN